MPQPEYKRVITVSAVNDKGTYIEVIAGEEAYTFFKKAYRKDEDSEAFKGFKFLGVKQNITVGIVYTVKDKYNNIQDFYGVRSEQIPANVSPFNDDKQLEKEERIIRGNAANATGAVMSGTSCTIMEFKLYAAQVANWIKTGK